MSENLERWKRALGWTTIPTAGAIHKLDKENFLASYYVPETIKEVTDRIVNSIREGYGFTHKTIVGEPGSGKTTFIYYLKATLDSDDSLDNYHLEVLHLQRMTRNGDPRETIEKRVLKTLSKYFSAAGKDKVYDDFVKDETDLKDKINNLEDYIVENREEFKKKLILVVDDIDETDEAVVELCIRHFYSLVECEQISKWIVVRSTTLNNYNKNLLDFISTKFPQRIPFPKVDLYGVINERVTNENPGGSNPFISELCHILLTTYNNDLRQAVHNYISFLEQTMPPKTAKNNAEFAGQFLLKNFTKVMSANGVFPNIYQDTILPTVPIEKDIFLILAARNRFYSGYLSVLDDHYKTFYRTIYKGEYADESYLISVNMDHVIQSINFLVKHELLVENDSLSGYYALTSRGESFMRFVMEKVYKLHCESEVRRFGQARHRVFWDLASQYPEYEPESKIQLKT